jgi:hypothetical protein
MYMPQHRSLRANSVEKLFAASANFPKLEICSPITGTYPKTPS